MPGSITLTFGGEREEFVAYFDDYCGTGPRILHIPRGGLVFPPHPHTPDPEPWHREVERAWKDVEASVERFRSVVSAMPAELREKEAAIAG